MSAVSEALEQAKAVWANVPEDQRTAQRWLFTLMRAMEEPSRDSRSKPDRAETPKNGSVHESDGSEGNRT
jgi:hypothetical protein